MPKDKERSVNPAAAQRKLEKQKNLKKGKAEALVRRNEKLARRNPDRIQRQISDLKQMQESGQKLRPREEQILEALERDLRAVQKAREALGDKAPKFFNDRRERGDGDGVLGKRRGGMAMAAASERIVTAARQMRRYEGYPCRGIPHRPSRDRIRGETQGILRHGARILYRANRP